MGIGLPPWCDQLHEKEGLSFPMKNVGIALLGSKDVPTDAVEKNTCRYPWATSSASRISDEIRVCTGA